MTSSVERLATQDKVIGENLPIRRALPYRARRMIGAWCFLDHAGPMLIQMRKSCCGGISWRAMKRRLLQRPTTGTLTHPVSVQRQVIWARV